MLAGLLLLIGGAISLAGLGLYVWEQLGPKPPALIAPFGAGFQPEVDMSSIVEIVAEKPDPEQVSYPPVEIGGNIVESLVPFDEVEQLTRVPRVYDGIDFGSEKDATFFFDLRGEDSYWLAPFTPHAWSPEIFTSGIFDYQRPEHHAVIWEDSAGRTGLWAHSGTDELMFPLQERFERNDLGWFLQYQEAQTYLKDHVYGSRVIMRQNNTLSYSRVAAVVRVGPEGVKDLQPHVMDMVPYLAESYAGTHFDSLLDRQDVLIIYFCGRKLAGEVRNPELLYWQQARFILALVPEGTWTDEQTALQESENSPPVE